jgi:hypothetical protein
VARSLRWWVLLLVLVLAVLLVVCRRAPRTERPVPVAASTSTSAQPAPVPPAMPRVSPAGARGPDGGAESGAGCAATCDAECQVVAGSPVCPPPCRSADDCAEYALCLPARLAVGGKGMRCLRSECTAPGMDRGCGPDRQCEYTGNPAGGIHQCRDTGVRALGEPCERIAGGAHERCQPGLHCTSGGCLPLSCTSNADCGLAGAPCAEIDGPDSARTCMSWCEDDSWCGAGMACVAVGLERRCVPSAQAGCLRDGCPDGEICLGIAAGFDSALAMCARPCPTGACSAGEVCAHVTSVLEMACLPTCERDRDCTAPARCLDVDSLATDARACLVWPADRTSPRERSRRYRVQPPGRG